MRYILLLIYFLFFVGSLGAQLTDSAYREIPTRYQQRTANKLCSVDRFSEKRLTAYLTSLEKIELKINRQYGYATDSIIRKKYKQLQDILTDTLSVAKISFYDAYTDTLSGALQFLKQVKGSTGNFGHATSVINRIVRSSDIEKALQERIQILSRITNGHSKYLNVFRKNVMYYRAQVTEIRSLLSDKRKALQKIIDAAKSSSYFKNFMQRNGMLAGLFPIPGSYGSEAALTGLQTRAAVSEIIHRRADITISGATGNTPNLNIPAQLQQQSDHAQSALQGLQNKIRNNAHDDTQEMPDFKPNAQKLKPFLKRIQWGYDLQTQGAKNRIPAITNIGLQLGYKLNDKSIIGIGACYKLGVGGNLRSLRFTHEGIGIRSFADVKLKGNIWISGGYEKNYMHAFRNVKGISSWQESGLIGVTKQIIIKQKKNMKVQLLYDFLDKKPIEQGQRFQFRTEWSW